MANLKCSVLNCSYNRDYYCCLAAIEVGQGKATHQEHTCCRSFKEDEYTNSNEVHEPCQSVDIACDAVHCVYNVYKICTANDVQIGSKHAVSVEDTDCLTFICE